MQGKKDLYLYCDPNKDEVFSMELEKCVACHLLDQETRLKIYKQLFSLSPPAFLINSPNLCKEMRRQILYLRKIALQDEISSKLSKTRDPQRVLIEFEKTFMENNDDELSLKDRLETLKKLQEMGGYMQDSHSATQINFRKDRIRRYIDLLPNETVSDILKTYFKGQYKVFDHFNRHSTFLASPFLVYDILDSNNMIRAIPVTKEQIPKLLLYSNILAHLASEIGMLPEYKQELFELYKNWIFRNVLPTRFGTEFLVKAYIQIMFPFWINQYTNSSSFPQQRRVMFLQQVCEDESQSAEPFDLEKSAIAYLTTGSDIYLHFHFNSNQLCDLFRNIIRKDLIKHSFSPDPTQRVFQAENFSWPAISLPEDIVIEHDVQPETSLEREERDVSVYEKRKKHKRGNE